MADYQRSTRECTVDGMRSTLTTALRAHASQHGLEEEVSYALTCCETISVRKKRGFLRSKMETISLGAVLTPRWLIWAVEEGDEEPVVLSARLSDIRVEDYADSSMSRLQADSGVTVYGLHTGDGIGTAFIGLGPEPAAQKFRDALQEAVARA